MQILEQSPEEQISRQFLSPQDQNIKIDNNINGIQNYNSSQAEQAINYQHNQPQLNPNFVPVIVYGQPIPGLEINNINPQVPSLEIQNNDQSDLLKHQPFKTQKLELVKLLIVLIIGSGIEFFLQQQCIIRYEKEIIKLSPIIFPLSLITLFLLAFASRSKVLQYFPIQMIVFIIYHILIGFGFISLCGLLTSEKPPDAGDGIYISVGALLLGAILVQIIGNAVVQAIVLLQILFETKKIHYPPSLIAIVLGTCISGYLFPLFIVTGIIGLYYGIMLLIILNQLQKGAFRLKVNQVFANINQIYSGALLPCCI